MFYNDKVQRQNSSLSLYIYIHCQCALIKIENFNNSLPTDCWPDDGVVVAVLCTLDFTVMVKASCGLGSVVE